MEKTTPRALLQARSLRFWIMAGMALALAPVVAAAVGGFILIDHGVIASFQHIADRQHNEIIPAQRVGLGLWDAAVSLNEFVEDGNATHEASFRAERTAIAADLAGLVDRMSDDPVAAALAKGAQEDWETAEDLGGDLISVSWPPGDPRVVEPMERFEGRVRAATDKLESLTERLESDLAEDQDAADIAYERALWLAGIAAGVCLLMVIGGIVLIGRVMSASVDRLVDGALRFAEGDRLHRIDVRVPPELKRVASEFNRMIIKIHAYEDILAERALKDVLTGLPNRRAFDEAITSNWTRVEQYGEPFAIVLLDIDHFKRVNDTYGHAVGDDVLRRVAEAIGQQLRAAHPVFRTGGEEFAVIVPGSGLAEARAVAERLRATVPVISVPVPGGEVNVTISAGVTDSHGVGRPDEMLQAADAALYRAKAAGRDRVISSGDVTDPAENAA